MGKFQNMLSRFGFRGSSDESEGKLDGKRSTNSTPRISRSQKVEQPQGFQRSYGSLSRIQDRSNNWKDPQQFTRRSFDSDRVLGLDKSWEMERTRGIELLNRSMERHGQVQSLSTGHLEAHRVDMEHHRSQDRSKKKKDRSKKQLEIKVQHLTQQLNEERQQSRRDKLMLVRLQSEIARNKSEGPVRESLMKELQHERMLRADAEKRLKEVTKESEACKLRLAALQDDFKKMDGMVKGVYHFKNKLDQLQNERVGLTVSYENNVQKFRTHISNLEQENGLLLAEVENLESKCNNCELCREKDTDKLTGTKLQSSSSRNEEAEKSKLLMERVKRMEAENSALVIENENQRQQYEKCLDDIANQVVQALITQKTLRETCEKFQNRVRVLEEQNKKLSELFGQQVQMKNTKQRMMSEGHGSCEPWVPSMDPNSYPYNIGAQTQGGQHQASARWELSHPTLSHPPGREDVASAFSEDSSGSLTSMFSDCNFGNNHVPVDEKTHKQGYNSLPRWLKGKLLPGRSKSSGNDPGPSHHTDSGPAVVRVQHSKSADLLDIEKITRDTSSQSLPESQLLQTCQKRNYKSATNVPSSGSQGAKRESRQPSLTRIETEFPIDNTSPKARHVNMTSANKQGDNIEMETDLQKQLSPGDFLESPVVSTQTTGIQTGDSISGSPEDTTKNGYNSSESPEENVKGLSEKLTCKQKYKKTDSSPGNELLKLTDSFHEKYILQGKDSIPRIQHFTYTDSDDSGDSRPVSKDWTMSSTTSLNELLERGLDELETPQDEEFSLNNFPLFDSDGTRLSLGPKDGDKEKLQNNLVPVLVSQDAPREPFYHPELNVYEQNNQTVQDTDSCQEDSSIGSPLSPSTVTNIQQSQNPSNQMVLNNSKMSNQLDVCLNNVRLLQRPNSLDFAPPANPPKQVKVIKEPNQNEAAAAPSSGEESDCLTPTNTFPPHQVHIDENSSKKPTSQLNYSVRHTEKNYEKVPLNKAGGSEMKMAAKPKVKPPVMPKPKKKAFPPNHENKCHNALSLLDPHLSDGPETLMTSSMGSSSSPDSAMQHSFSSSSSSDPIPCAKQNSRDDGYSSNSAASIAQNDSTLKGEAQLAVKIQEAIMLKPLAKTNTDFDSAISCDTRERHSPASSLSSNSSVENSVSEKNEIAETLSCKEKNVKVDTLKNVQVSPQIKSKYMNNVSSVLATENNNVFSKDLAHQIRQRKIRNEQQKRTKCYKKVHNRSRESRNSSPSDSDDDFEIPLMFNSDSCILKARHQKQSCRRPRPKRKSTKNRLKQENEDIKDTMSDSYVEQYVHNYEAEEIHSVEGKESVHPRLLLNRCESEPNGRVLGEGASDHYYESIRPEAQGCEEKVEFSDLNEKLHGVIFDVRECKHLINQGHDEHSSGSSEEDLNFDPLCKTREGLSSALPEWSPTHKNHHNQKSIPPFSCQYSDARIPSVKNPKKLVKPYPRSREEYLKFSKELANMDGKHVEDINFHSDHMNSVSPTTLEPCDVLRSASMEEEKEFDEISKQMASSTHALDELLQKFTEAEASEAALGKQMKKEISQPSSSEVTHKGSKVKSPNSKCHMQ